jgi:hypothetical protein
LKRKKITDYFTPVSGEELRDEIAIDELIVDNAPKKKRKNNSRKYAYLDKDSVVEYALVNGIENTLVHYKAYEIPQQTLSDWMQKKKDGIPLHGMNHSIDYND